MIISYWDGLVITSNRRLKFNRNKSRFIPNPEYKTFKDSLAWKLKKDSNGIKFKKEHIRVGILAMYKKRNRVVDIDGIVKPCLDAITDAGIIDDDRYVKRLNVMSEEIKGNMDCICITIEKINKGEVK